MEQFNDVARLRATTQSCLQVHPINALPLRGLLTRTISHCALRVSPMAVLLARAVQNTISASSTSRRSQTSTRRVTMVSVRCALASTRASPCAAAVCCCLALMRAAAQLCCQVASRSRSMLPWRRHASDMPHYLHSSRVLSCCAALLGRHLRGVRPSSSPRSHQWSSWAAACGAATADDWTIGIASSASAAPPLPSRSSASRAPASMAVLLPPTRAPAS